MNKKIIYCIFSIIILFFLLKINFVEIDLKKGKTLENIKETHFLSEVNGYDKTENTVYIRARTIAIPLYFFNKDIKELRISKFQSCPELVCGQF